MNKHGGKRLSALLLSALLAGLLTMPCFAQGDAAPRGYVALTFDDGPTAGVTSTLLEGLAGRKVNATFFLCGYRIELFPELIEDYVAGGHEIGIHGYSHAYLNDLDATGCWQELHQTLDLLEVQGVHPTLFRAPGGLTSQTLQTEAALAGLSLIHWSVDPQDWCCTDPEVLVERVMSKVQPGDIILMHELKDSSVQAALSIIDCLRQRGLEPVTVSQLAALEGKTLKPGGTYFRFS